MKRTEILSASVALVIVGILLASTGGVSASPTAGGGTSPPSTNLARAAGSTSPDWPTYLDNVARTSNSTNETWLTPGNAAELGTSWTFKSGGPIVSSTTVVGGIAYFGSWNGEEYAVRVSSHALVWKRYLGIDSFDPACGSTNDIGISSAPTVTGGTLYVTGGNTTGGRDNAFFALNGSSGKILWSVPLGNMSRGNYSWASPLIYGKDAYIGLASNCDEPLVPAGLVAISLTTHRIVARFDTMPDDLLGASIWSTPSVNVQTGTIYVTTGNAGADTSTHAQNYSESIVALSVASLQLQSSWMIPAAEAVEDGDFGAGATVLHGVIVKGKAETLVVAGNKDGYEYAWNASDVGKGPLWGVQTHLSERELISPAAYGGGLVYFDTPKLLFNGKSAPGAVFAVYPSNGTVAWKDALSARGLGAPLYVNGLVVVATGSYLEVLNAATGHAYVDREVCPSGNFVAAPSIAEGYVFVGCESGVLYAFNIMDSGSEATVLAISSPYAPNSYSPPVQSTVLPLGARERPSRNGPLPRSVRSSLGIAGERAVLAAWQGARDIS